MKTHDETCCKCNRKAIGYSRTKWWCWKHAPPRLIDSLKENARRCGRKA